MATHTHDHHDAAAHIHGEMDTRAQERTFDGFISAVKWTAIASIAVVIFLALANA